jgi:ATP-binding cassette subfamily F protein 3
MISIQNISLQYGSRELLRDVNLLIRPHDRIGLVGANGTGKTTLMKIITGLERPDSGNIAKAHYVTLGYLPQEGIAAAGPSLYTEVEKAFEEIVEAQENLREANENLGMLSHESEEYMECLEIIGELHHRLEDLDAFRMRSKIEKVLVGLGFRPSDFERRVEEFSGGWQMRVALAKLLLQEPSLLLLDEPTNHLDIESLQWIEEYLQNYDGAVLMVSHDRRFLDTITHRTLAIFRGHVDDYNGNYTFYENESVIRKEQQERALKNQQVRVKQTQEFIERFRYKATKARQVQSRIKQLEKMDIVGVEDNEEEIHFEFPPAPSSGRIVMEFREVVKRYGSLLLFNKLNCIIERGDRIAIVGVNGAGKSTFARLLANVEPFNSGERIAGHNVTLSYFAQDQADELDPKKETLDILNETAEGEIRTKLRTILGAFLFHGDDVFKPVAVLSGGEKSRLALAKMLLKPSNFLILDEPTNHLDMRSKNVLQQALQSYTGSYVIVSHDRSFLEPIINKVLEFSPTGMRTYLGTMDDYLYKKKQEKETPAIQIKRFSTDTTSSVYSDKERKRLEAQYRQERSRVLSPMKKKVDTCEKEVERLEKLKNEIEASLHNPELYKKGEAVKRISTDVKRAQNELQRAMARWENAMKEYEKAEKRWNQTSS